MIWRKVRRNLTLGCLTLAASSAIDCQSTEIKKAPLASGCELDSDCDAPLVCGFARCHVRCKTSVDCGGARCLISEAGNVCQLLEEQKCVYNTDCPDSLICGADEQCHNECKAKRDCLNGQICTPEGECADPAEVDMGGSLKLPLPDESSAGAAGSDAGAPGVGGSAGSAPSDDIDQGGKGSGGSAGRATVTAGAGSASAGTHGGGEGSNLPSVALKSLDGWIAASSNALMIQGAVFGYADPVSAESLEHDFTGSNACISGVAAQVDLTCTPMAPATDCYGMFWGAAIGMNLNQPLDTTVTPAVGGAAGPYDASGLKGFTFELSGRSVPGPANLRFKVESETTEFCNVPSVKLKVGSNTVLFTDLVAQCYIFPTPSAPLATSAQTGLIKLAWQVVTTPSSTVPYDFCISNVQALRK